MKLSDENGNEYEFDPDECSGSLMGGVLREIKPEPKKIDMSVCIESDIDCEFSNTNVEWFVDELLDETEMCEYMSGSGDAWKYCRPRFNHIHASPTGWGKCPVPKGFIFRVWFSDFIANPSLVTDFTRLKWENIIMFEITSHQDGWSL